MNEKKIIFILFIFYVNPVQIQRYISKGVQAKMIYRNLLTGEEEELWHQLKIKDGVAHVGHFQRQVLSKGNIF